MPSAAQLLDRFQAPVAEWFRASFSQPTLAQVQGWGPILAGKSVALLAPTGSGKTLAAFLAALDRLMFTAEPVPADRLRVLYVSPLKALGVDIERNLRVPIAGIAEIAARRGIPHRVPTLSIRSGDTPSSERSRFARTPPDVLITTPESLYLLLTSRARQALASVDTVIVDEIHAVASSKRGVHLFVSLERLELLRASRQPLQRIGLSATQRPLTEVARLLGGGEIDPEGGWSPRPVTVVDASAHKPLDVRVEVPVDDMTQLPLIPTGGAASPDGIGNTSIWPAIHPRLVELIRQHRSTLLFVNNRRLSERLSAALNEEAGEELALAHHGSIAKDRRLEIEERLKQGTLPALVATSSLELGIDMGAVDLVIQVESPPSVAGGLQRIGRAGHSVEAVSRGVVFPKYRGDLVAAAAAVEHMLSGKIEETRTPKNPLDVVAQQVAAMVAMDDWDVEHLYRVLRQATPLCWLPRDAFEGVLDMLSGKYPSQDFSALRPRVVWDRARGRLRARRGLQRVAVVNGGTIPDRGLYGVFLAGAEPGAPVRVGELDEEMVFESRRGEVFLLGASSWRIEEITHDRVTVSPAPGEPGRMPFWHGDHPGRPAEFGRAVGELTRTLLQLGDEEALEHLRSRHGLDERAARNLLAYVRDQDAAIGAVPHDRQVVIERYTDELGDLRVCVLSPFGARVHAPWSMAIQARLAEQITGDILSIYTDDGMAFRLPATEQPPPADLLLPAPEEIERRIQEGLGDTSLFAARFRENAARALLLPRRRPGQRTPLWAQRKRAAELLRVANRFRSFPMVLETYRECLQDVFDLPALIELMRQIRARHVAVRIVDSQVPSPFAASLVFSYVASFIYDGDAPSAERRTQALGLDQVQLRELLGEAELRELLDPEVIDDVERDLQRLEHGRARDQDEVHDVLLVLGDLDEQELAARCVPGADASSWLGELMRDQRIITVMIGDASRYAAAEDAARLRDGVGAQVPAELPGGLLQPVADPLLDIVSRYARTHVPFRATDLASRYRLSEARAREVLDRLEAAGRVVSGSFLPGGRGREWCAPDVLRLLKQRTLVRLRKEIEPVSPVALARFMLDWQHVARPLEGRDGLLAAVEQLQGASLPGSTLLGDVLPARLRGFSAADLDALVAEGTVAWRGLGPLGSTDGRVALYLAADFVELAPDPLPVSGKLAGRLHELLAERGASFFSELVAATGAFVPDLVEALWDLVWAGHVTNDTLAPLRSRYPGARPTRPHGRRRAVLRRLPPGTEGRWSLLSRRYPEKSAPTAHRVALARMLLARYGVITREAVASEGIPGGFAGVYPILRALEESGQVRRGHFVSGLGAAQFAEPGADEALRARRSESDASETVVLAATDPANPYGAALPWPPAEPRPQRVPGSYVIVRDGRLIGVLGRSGENLTTFVRSSERDAQSAHAALAGALAGAVDTGDRQLLRLATVDGCAAKDSPLAPHLVSAGFIPVGRGLLKRKEAKGS